MSLFGTLKFTSWIILTLLLVSFPLRALAADPLIILTSQTKEHIKGLYAHHFIHDLMNVPQHQERYLEVLFAHFRSDFQDWANSRWPTLLQDLELLPAVYCTDDARQNHRLMQDEWERKREHLQPDPIDGYHQTEVRVPPVLANVFQNDKEHYNWRSRSIHYDFLVEEMQRFVDDYPANDFKSKRKWRRDGMTGRLLRFKAIYWLTVLDKFIGTVQLANAVDGVLLASPFPRTVLIRPNLVAQQAPGFGNHGSLAAPVVAPVNAILNPVVPPMLFPHPAMENPVAQPGSSGFNSALRTPSAAAGAKSRGTKRKTTDQDDGPSQGSGKRGPGGAMRSMDSASNQPKVGLQALRSNSVGNCTALSWISLIMVTIAVSLISFD